MKQALADQKAKILAGTKKVVTAKSLLIFEVKPWELETDLDALAK